MGEADMKYKAVIFDIDGTAVENAQYAKPSKRLIDEVQRAKDKAYICAATGRIWATAKWVIEPLKLTAPCIISAGAEIINPVSKQILWNKIMNKQQVSEILTIAKTFPYVIHCASQLNDFPKVTKLQVRDESVVYIDNVPEEVQNEIVKKLSAIADIAIHQGPGYVHGSVNFNITHKEATKSHAIAELIRMIGVQKEEIIGVGDGDNDMPLFDAVGWKVAVGNATENLKKNADEIVSSAKDDGLAKVIQKYIL